MIFYLCVFWLFWIHFPFFAALPFQVENSPPRKERGGSLRGPRLPLRKGSQVTQAGPLKRSALESDSRVSRNKTYDRDNATPHPVPTPAQTMLWVFLLGLQSSLGSCSLPGLVLNRPFNQQTTNISEINFL